ncbi:hypothetical protein [Pandoravirus japonicus]|uniref:Uncharacterized protein n=1 Tax=Pandoravirus japonicus TaxID=2823154 RepID=A0A811BPJ6_9VIRU|nr:hypothetical protein [Pandoravirus japonicus]
MFNLSCGTSHYSAAPAEAHVFRLRIPLSDGTLSAGTRPVLRVSTIARQGRTAIFVQVTKQPKSDGEWLIGLPVEVIVNNIPGQTDLAGCVNCSSMMTLEVPAEVPNWTISDDGFIAGKIVPALCKNYKFGARTVERDSALD